MSDLILKAQGKTTIVTGGARGIGRKSVETFLHAGSHVVIADIDLKAGETTAKELSSIGPKVVAIKTDVSNPQSIQAMVEHAQAVSGRIDILFNNAGICLNEAAETMSLASWKKVIDINLTGVFLVAQAVGRIMIAQRGGVIINTASMSAHIVNHPQPQCAYNAAKAGVVQLTKSLAVEWGRYGIRVNSISPGYIATEMTLKASNEWKSDWIRQSVHGRMGRPDELQSALLYLASEQSSFTNGADLLVDGAFTCV